MSERGDSSQRRHRRASDREVAIPTTVRAPKTNARRRVTGSSNATPIPDPVDTMPSNQWSKVYSEEGEHLSKHFYNPTVSAKITCMGSPKFCCEMYSMAARMNARVKACIDNTGWNWICSVPVLRHDQKLLVALFERWWPSTHTFHLPFLEIGFTPYDFVCLTGISVGMGDYPPFAIQKWKSMQAVRQFFPSAVPADCLGTGPKTAFLKDVLEELELTEVEDASQAPTREEAVIEERWLRAFFLLALGEIFFPVSKKFVSFGWFEAVEHVSVMGSYDWGSVFMARMYNCLDELAEMKIRKAQFCWTVLEVYAIFTFMILTISY